MGFLLVKGQAALWSQPCTFSCNPPITDLILCYFFCFTSVLIWCKTINMSHQIKVEEKGLFSFWSLHYLTSKTICANKKLTKIIYILYPPKFSLMCDGFWHSSPFLISIETYVGPSITMNFMALVKKKSSWRDPSHRWWVSIILFSYMQCTTDVAMEY